MNRQNFVFIADVSIRLKQFHFIDNLFKLKASPFFQDIYYFNQKNIPLLGCIALAYHLNTHLFFKKNAFLSLWNFVNICWLRKISLFITNKKEIHKLRGIEGFT